MVTVVVFEDACADIQEWDKFDEETIKEYVGWEKRMVGDDRYTSIEWVTDYICSIPFGEGPHFIFIKQS